MVAPNQPDTEKLLDAARHGDPAARSQLLERHRPRLRRMVAVRVDRRLAARLDPSDVVQEAMLDANAQLDNYLRDRPIPFYPWLRRLAYDRMVDAYRHHISARRRSVDREQPIALPDASVSMLMERLLGRTESPSVAVRRRELQRRLRTTLDRLPSNDREILILRYLEDMTTAEAAAVIGVTEGTAKVRLFRAMQRLRELLDQESLT